MRSGISCVFSVVGWYWMSSMRSLRNTTWPAVAAMLRPSSNGDVSTCFGQPPLWITSSTAVPDAAEKAPSAGLGGAAQDGRVGRDEVGRGDGIGDQIGGKAGLGEGGPLQSARLDDVRQQLAVQQVQLQ